MFSSQKARWLVTCALVFATPAAFAVDQSMGTQREMKSSSEIHAQRTGNVDLARASSVIGHEVMDNQGNKIGTVKDVVLNTSGDRIVYVALAYGGIAGIGDTFLAVPWNAYTLTPTMTEKGSPGLLGERSRDFKLTLNASKNNINTQAGFKESQWPTQASSEWQKGARQESMTGGTGEVWRLSKLIGQKVNSERPLQLTSTRIESNKPIGELKDVALGIHTGTPVYGEVTLTQDPSHKDFHSVVPWSALSFRMLNNQPTVALNVPDEKTLLTFAYPSHQQLPALGEQQYAEKIYTAYNQRPDWEMLGFVSPEPSMSIEQRSHMGESKSEHMRPVPSEGKMKTEPKRY